MSISQLNLKLDKITDILKDISEIEGIVFIGGTSLTLLHNAITRFSEDVDLSIMPGFTWKEIKPKLLKVLKKHSTYKPIKLNMDKSSSFVSVYMVYYDHEQRGEYDFGSIKIEIAKQPQEHIVNQIEKKEIRDSGVKILTQTLEQTYADKIWATIRMYLSLRRREEFSNKRGIRHVSDLISLMDKVDYDEVSKCFTNKLETDLKRWKKQKSDNFANYILFLKKLEEDKNFDVLYQVIDDMYRKENIEQMVEWLVEADFIQGYKKSNYKQMLETLKKNFLSRIA